ncbi:MAG: hypothetical protein ND866_25390 [Pyrinomonadaceae bacterium]|nr:hypothetical protein [Pyrinomonadaceae bacterium]
MRLREFLFGSALMSIALVTTKASAPTDPSEYCRPDFGDGAARIVETRTSVSLPSAPSPLISQDKVLGSAYYDTVSILSSDNPCSDFFGGPTSVEIFNELVSKIRKDALSVGIAMRMSGVTTNVHDAKTKRNFRIFDKVSLNSNGPFYRKRVAPWEPSVPRVGPFEPNTQEARVLILLHELGHVMKGSDGHWLLPDDGKDEGLSRANSYKIEDVCEGELKSLSKVITTKDLGKYKGPDQQSVPTTSGRTQP